MILIGECGASKSDWALIHNNSTRYISDGPIHPFHLQGQQINKTLESVSAKLELGSHIPMPKIYYYGTGCGSTAGAAIIKDALYGAFSCAEPVIASDIEGAAFALFGQGSGYAAILGTGSNFCRWEKGSLAETYISPGYLLGDEGSGYQIGRLLVMSYIRGTMPGELACAFTDRFATSQAELAAHIYKSAAPAKTIAGYSLFAGENIAQPFIIKLVEACFSSFFDVLLQQAPMARQSVIKCTGSVAHKFGAQLKNQAWNKGCQIAQIEQKPIVLLAERFCSK
jgi:glucosamine kinase